MKNKLVIIVLGILVIGYYWHQVSQTKTLTTSLSEQESQTLPVLKKSQDIIEKENNQKLLKQALSMLADSQNIAPLEVNTSELDTNKSSNQLTNPSAYPQVVKGGMADEQYWVEVNQFIQQKVEQERNTNQAFADEFQRHLDYQSSGYQDYTTEWLESMAQNGDALASLALIERIDIGDSQRIEYLQSALKQGLKSAYTVYINTLKTGDFEQRTAYLKVAYEQGSALAGLNLELSYAAYKAHNVPLDQDKVESHEAIARSILINQKD